MKLVPDVLKNDTYAFTKLTICLILLAFALITSGCSRQSSPNAPGAQVSGPGATPSEFYLQVEVVPQKLSNWCWAASGQMAIGYLGKQIEQCDEANKEFRRGNCCPANDECNSGGWPQFEKYQFASQKTCRQAISWDQLKEEIANKRPVAFSWLYEDDSWTSAGDPSCVKGGTGHMMVATGYQEKNGKRIVFYNDPVPPKGKQYQVPYEEFAQVTSLHRHWNDFFMIQKVNENP